jgi:multidrug efflux pump subunit AcrA (membrane-fusion protein)
VLVVLAVTSFGSGSSSSSAAAKRTATVGKGVVQSTVSGNGTLEPAQKVELDFGASGEVTAIYTKSGEKVEKGEVLAEIDSSAARASLASAEAQLLEAEETLEGAEEAENEEAAYVGGGRTVFVGLMSEEGTGAAKDEESADEGTAPEEGATGTEKTAPGKEEAEKEATKPGTTTSGENEEAAGGGESTEGKEEAAAPEATAQAPATETATAAPSESSSGGTEGGTGSASVSVPTAEANLREAELTVKSARQEVRETTLRAPISGTITAIAGSVGENVSGEASGSTDGGSSEAAVGGLGATGGGSSESSSSGSAFMTLAQVHRLKMEVSFSESDIGKVREGQTATVSVDALEGVELAGEVTKVSVLPSEASSSVVEYPATILVTQSAKGVRAGMSASAEVVVEQVKDAITVPSEAITSVGGKSVTVEEHGKEVTRSISTGLVGDETTQVIRGLKVGETLVLPETTIAGGSLGTEGGADESGRFPGGGAFPGGGNSGFTLPSGGAFPGGAP